MLNSSHQFSLRSVPHDGVSTENVHKESDKTDCTNYRGIPYVNEIL